jgi:hypothetical protein
MSRTASIWTVAAVAAGLTAGGAEAGPALTGSAEQLADLSGSYRSTAAEDWGRGAYGKRAFTLDHGRWTLSFQLALDPGFHTQVFAFRTRGVYRVAEPSKAVPGAFETDFREEAKYVTLLTPDAELARGFGLAGCGLAPGVEKDVSASGCAMWKPVAVCGEDHDLLALDTAGGLHFGVRPADNDMCTPDKRPRALLPAVVKE